jgi:uncharacterized protein YndB with AHSA1/START domain
MTRHEDDESLSLVVRRTIPIPRERVFDAWLDPVRLAQFMRPGSTTSATVEVDSRVGGRFRIVMRHPGSKPDEGVHTGEYLLIERPSRLSFTWQSAATDDRPTTVTIDFIERGAHTEIVLTHRGIPPRTIEAHHTGWGDILRTLADERAAQSPPIAAAD